MSTLTPKGISVPENDVDDFDPEGDLGAIATWVDDHPGISTYTTAERDVLVGEDIWAGRVIYNSSTERLEINRTGDAGAANWTADVPTDAAAATASLRTLGTGAQQAAAGNDARLSNSRTPTGAAGGKLSGNYPNPGIAGGGVGTAELADGAVTSPKVSSALKDAVAATASLRTLGTGAQQAAAGNDARLSNSRTPTGPAGGKLSGNYPNPGIAGGGVGTPELADGAVTAAKMDDTDWQDIAMVAGFVGTARVRRIGNLVTVQGDGSFASTSGTDHTLSASPHLPADMRPSSVAVRGGAYFTGHPGTVSVFTNGEIHAIQISGGGRSSVAFTITYMVG